MAEKLIRDVQLWISKRPQAAIGTDTFVLGTDYLRAVTDQPAYVLPKILYRDDRGRPGNGHNFPTRRCADRIDHPGFTITEEVHTSYPGRLALRSTGGVVTTAQQGGTAAFKHSNKMLNALLSRQLPPSTLISIIGGADFRNADMVVDAFRMEQNRADAPRYSATLIGSGKFLQPNGIDVRQIETATAAGTVTGTGNAKATVTAAGMSGSPKIVLFAVTSTDTATVWAGKARVALAADPSVGGFFTISGTGTAIILTARVHATNDATLNVALDNDTSTGITPAPTSANTTAGAQTLPAVTVPPCFDGNLTEFFWTGQAGLRTLTGAGCTIMSMSGELGNATKLGDHCSGDPTVTIVNGALTVTPKHVRKMKHGDITVSFQAAVLLDDTIPDWFTYATGEELTDVTFRANGPMIESPFRHSLAMIIPRAAVTDVSQTEIEGEAAMQMTIEPLWDVADTALQIEVVNTETANYD